MMPQLLAYTVDDFLKAPVAEVAGYAPASIVYAPSGTRRGAALAGVPLQGAQFAHWMHQGMVNACDILFTHGVRNIFTLAIGSGQFDETGDYPDQMVDWLEWGLTDPKILAEYDALGWRVRLLTDDAPRLRRIADQLHAHELQRHTKTLWYTVATTAESPWGWIIQAIVRSGARSRRDAVYSLYGEDVPLVTLFLSFGKPIVTAELFPPLLVGKVQCYWSQRPGYALTVHDWRLILYDYAFLRTTWQADKSDRTKDVLNYRTLWERGPILGLGQRLGPFWYPLQTDWPALDDGTDEPPNG